MKDFFASKTKLIVFFLFVFGVFLIFFLSWKSNPNLEGLWFIPDWLSSWTDKNRNNQIRTGVPFIGLGILVGAYLIYNQKKSPFFWFFSWILLVIIVYVAEAGQYFLPARVVDIKDVIWGGIGAAIGLIFSFFFWQIRRMFKNKLFENEKY